MLVDPPAVIRALEQGWHKHIPLHLLANSRCRASSHDAPTPQSTLAVIEDGQIHMREAPFDSSGESSMSIAEFFEAWPRFCDLIERYLLSPDKLDIAAAFRLHFKGITSRTDFSMDFPLYLKYDIHIRQRFVQFSDQFTPASFQVDVWNSIVDRSRSDDFRAFRSSLNSFRAPATKPSHSGSSSSTNATGHASLSKKPTSSKHSDPKPGVCFVCLDPSHRGRKCPRKENGYIVKDAEGHWKGPGDVLLCFRWNGPYGCDVAKCEFRHACTVCGSSDHSAQSHPPL